MMPNDSLSQTTQQYGWRGLDQSDPTGELDYESGGINLHDVSQGLEYQLWTFYFVGMSAYVTAPNQSAPILLFTLTSEIQEINGCFDQNMAPFVAYKSGNQYHYWWFDTVGNAYVFSDLPTTVDSCKCTLDDKRQFNSSNSDILLFYTNTNNLYMRRQRDRYQTEMLLKTGVGGKLVKVGMNGIERLQFKLVTTQ